MQQYDVVIIGAGHNGLVCAAYLLKAGYSVALLEKRSVPGGAATTEELLPKEAPGFKFNLCAIDHEFIHLGPVVEELELEKYGLEYLDCDPVVFCPHPDGKYFLGHKSLEKTCAEIARYSQRDALKYKEFTEERIESREESKVLREIFLFSNEGSGNLCYSHFYLEPLCTCISC